MSGEMIQTTDLQSTFKALRNQDPAKMMGNKIPYSPDYKSIPQQNLAPTTSANTGSWGNGMAKFASGVVYGQPQFFSPVHTPINWQIPSKRLEQYQWARFFYENEPKVASAIDFYSYFPMNNYTNECKDRKIRSYFDKFKKRLELPKWTRLMSHEVHLLGDCFPFIEVSCPNCFPADTMVLTDNGHKRIQDMKVDDMVLTVSGEYLPVIKTMSFRYKGTMVEIHRQSLPSIKSTSDHKHFVVRPEYRPDNRVQSAQWDSPIEVEAKDIKCGDYIAAPFNSVLKSDIGEICYDGSLYRFKNKNLCKKNNIVLDEGFAGLMGWYVAEGSTDSNRSFQFTLNCEDEALVGEQIKVWLEEYFDQGSEVKEFWTQNVRQVFGYSRELSGWLDDHCGHGSFNKKVPYFIMRSSKKIKEAFLKAYLAGDGSSRKSRNENSLTTISKTLCFDLVAILSDLGYSCYVDEKEEGVDNLGIHRCHCYRINYRIAEKRKNGQGTYKNNNFVFFKVKDVLFTEEDTVVYNMTVEKDHSYVANYCYTKNCGGSGRIGDELCEHEGGTVRRIVILNPDYVEVYTSPLNPEPVIALKPDEELINMVQKKTPGYERLTPEVIKLISSGQPIRLDNRNVFHLKYGEGGYSKYGVGMVRRLFPILSYKTKLMVAQWIVAERLIVPIKVIKVGTDERPAGPADIAAVQSQLAQTANDPNLTIVTHHAFDLEWYGACFSSDTEVLTENGWKKYEDVSKNFDEKIATYNLNNEKIEYEIPQKYHEYDYNGDMISFESKDIDILVTPNHKMLIKINDKWGEVEAQDVEEIGGYYSIKSSSTWDRDFSLLPENVSINSKDNVSRKYYNGKVWCFTVPNGFFITRRNGKVTIQGNSGKVLTLSNEFEFINQEILDGLMINNALLNGEGPNFSSAAVGIEAMIERLETFRNEISDWIEECIYKPEALRQGFVEVDPETEEEELVYPSIKWNSMHLRDQQQHRTFMIQLYEKGLVSAQTVLETFDLDPDQEIERKRYDAVQMMALGQGMGQMGGGAAGGAAGGGMPAMGGMPGDMGGAPGGDMGAGAPIAPGGDTGGAPAMASSSNRMTTANPSDYGGKVLKQKTRERLDQEKSKMYHQQEKVSAQQTRQGEEMRDGKGRIIFTKPERLLMDQLVESQKNGLIKYPITPQFEVAHVTGQNYLIDFAIPSLKIGIEADGEAFHSSPKQIQHDSERDMQLAQTGWTILRFSDTEIEKIPEQVTRTIIQNIMQKELSVKAQQEDKTG